MPITSNDDVNILLLLLKDPINKGKTENKQFENINNINIKNQMIKQPENKYFCN